MSKEKGLPLTSNHWGTYRAKVEDGKVKDLIGWEHDKDPSPIGPGILDVLEGPTRIGSPMFRKSWLEEGPGSKNNLRGIDPFIKVSWEKAEKLIANELNRVRKNLEIHLYMEGHMDGLVLAAFTTLKASYIDF